MEGPSRQARRAGDPGPSHDRKWSSRKAAPLKAGNATAGPYGHMPGSYTMSNEDVSVPAVVFDTCCLLQEEWHDPDARTIIKGTAINDRPSSKNSTGIRSEYVIEIESPKTVMRNAQSDIKITKSAAEDTQSDIGSFSRRSLQLQFPAPVYHRNVGKIHNLEIVRQPIGIRSNRLSSTWASNGYVPEGQIYEASDAYYWYPQNTMDSRNVAWSDVFSSIREGSIASVDAPSAIIIADEDLDLEQGSKSVVTPATNSLAVMSYDDKTPGFIRCIFSAVKNFIFSCAGVRPKDLTHQHRSHSQTRSDAPVEEFVVDIQQETENIESTPRPEKTYPTGEHNLPSREYDNYLPDNGEDIEDDQIGHIQIGYQQEREAEREPSILLPPCPAFAAEENTREGPQRKYSRPMSYPGAPENESLATIRREILQELGEMSGDTLQSVGVFDDDSDPDGDDYHEVLRKGLKTTAGRAEPLPDTGEGRAEPDINESCLKTPKKSKKGPKRRLNGMISPIIGAASLAVKSLLYSSPPSSSPEDDESSSTYSESSRPATPTTPTALIRAAIGTSITSARKHSGLGRNGGDGAEVQDRPKEIMDPRLSKFFERDFYEDEIFTSTPESKGRWQYDKETVYYELQNATVPEETEDSLWMFEHGYYQEEDDEDDEDGDETTEEASTINHISASENSEEEGSDKNPGDTLGHGILSPDVYEGHSFYDDSEDPEDAKEDANEGLRGTLERSEDEETRIRNARKYYEEAFHSMFKDNVALEAFFSGDDDHDDDADSSKNGSYNENNDHDGCKESVHLETVDIPSPTPLVVKNKRESAKFSQTIPAVKHGEDIGGCEANTASIMSWEEAIRTLREDLDILGIGPSTNALADEDTMLSRHTSVMSVVQTIEVKRTEFSVHGTPTASSLKERSARISYTHSYNPDDKVDSDEDNDTGVEYKIYYGEGQQLMKG